MSEERQGCNCHAYGCPMPAALSTSTTGAKADWLCWIHFGADASEWQQITAELNRVSWLVEAVSILRHAHRGEWWAHAVKAARKRLVAAQRSDLVYREGETAAKWITRLETELKAIARGTQQALSELSHVAPQQQDQLEPAFSGD